MLTGPDTRNIERLVREAADIAKKARLQADCILCQLARVTQERVVAAPRRCFEEESTDSDTEPGWRLAA